MRKPVVQIGPSSFMKFLIANIVYTTNLNTGVQYKFDNDEWILSFEGEYPNGSWLFQY